LEINRLQKSPDHLIFVVKVFTKSPYRHKSPDLLKFHQIWQHCVVRVSGVAFEITSYDDVAVFPSPTCHTWVDFLEIQI
jgi:hypothetical protein